MLEPSFNKLTPVPAVTKVRCPKCRSNNLELTECIWATTTWTVTDGKLNVQNGFHEPGGVDHMEATCLECRHNWRMRGRTLQIYDVVDLIAES